MFHFVRGAARPQPFFGLDEVVPFFAALEPYEIGQNHRADNYVAADVATYQPSTKDKLVVTYEATEPPVAAKAEKPPQIDAKSSLLCTWDRHSRTKT